MFTTKRFGAIMLAAGVVCLPAVAAAESGSDSAVEAVASSDARTPEPSQAETADAGAEYEGGTTGDAGATSEVEGAALLLVRVDGKVTRTVVEIDDESFEPISERLSEVRNIGPEELETLLDEIGAFDFAGDFAPALGEFVLEGEHEISIGGDGFELARFTVAFPVPVPMPEVEPEPDESSPEASQTPASSPEPASPEPASPSVEAETEDPTEAAATPAERSSAAATPAGQSSAAARSAAATPAERSAAATPTRRTPAAAETAKQVTVDEVVELVEGAIEALSVVADDETLEPDANGGEDSEMAYVNRPLTQRPSVASSPIASDAPTAASESTGEPSEEVPTAENVKKKPVRLPVTGAGKGSQGDAVAIDSGAAASEVKADEAAVESVQEPMFVASPERAAAVAVSGAAAIGLLAAGAIVAIRKVN